MRRFGCSRGIYLYNKEFLTRLERGRTFFFGALRRTVFVACRRPRRPRRRSAAGFLVFGVEGHLAATRQWRLGCTIVRQWRRGEQYCDTCYRRTRSRCPSCALPPRISASTQTEISNEFSLANCLDSGDLADVEIFVDCVHFPGQQAIFKAHKMILAVQNDVFKAMFYGDFAKEDRVVITDLHPEGFRGLLRYFYSGRLDIVSVHQAACTRTAAAKYRVPELEKMCLCFMNSCMKLDEVCPFLDYVLTMGEQDMATCASALICKDSLGVLYSPTFPYSTEVTVRFILCHATNVAEASVVRAMFVWAQLQWLKRFEDSEDCSVRSIMLPLFPELRFLMLTASELVEGPIAWKIFTDAEALAILSNVVKEGSMPMPKGFCQIRKPRT